MIMLQYKKFKWLILYSSTWKVFQRVVIVPFGDIVHCFLRSLNCFGNRVRLNKLYRVQNQNIVLCIGTIDASVMEIYGVSMK